MTTTAPPDLRCTAQARLSGPGPIGTAGSATAVALVEVPLPWPKDVADAVPSVAAAAAEAGARLQAIVPDPERLDRGEALVVVHRRGGDRFRGYERHAVTVATSDVPDALRALAGGSAGGGAGGDADAGADEGAPAPGIDVLVCTHGTRDRCCGSLGTTLHRSLRRPDTVSVHRTSHLGGHRFAPTAALLPSGTVWAWLDHTVLGAIIERRVAPADVIAHYRGSMGMAHQAIQAAEAAAFAEVGWAWLDHERDGWCEPDGADRWRVGIDGTAGAWRAVVERVGSVPQPVCGRPIDAAKKADDHLRLVSAGWE